MSRRSLQRDGTALHRAQPGTALRTGDSFVRKRTELPAEHKCLVQSLVAYHEPGEGAAFLGRKDGAMGPADVFLAFDILLLNAPSG